MMQAPRHSSMPAQLAHSWQLPQQGQCQRQIVEQAQEQSVGRGHLTSAGAASMVMPSSRVQWSSRSSSCTPDRPGQQPHPRMRCPRCLALCMYAAHARARVLDTANALCQVVLNIQLLPAGLPPAPGMAVRRARWQPALPLLTRTPCTCSTHSTHSTRSAGLTLRHSASLPSPSLHTAAVSVSCTTCTCGGSRRHAELHGARLGTPGPVCRQARLTSAPHTCCQSSARPWGPRCPGLAGTSTLLMPPGQRPARGDQMPCAAPVRCHWAGGCAHPQRLQLGRDRRLGAVGVALDRLAERQVAALAQAVLHMCPALGLFPGCSKTPVPCPCASRASTCGCRQAGGQSARLAAAQAVLSVKEWGSTAGGRLLEGSEICHIYGLRDSQAGRAARPQSLDRGRYDHQCMPPFWKHQVAQRRRAVGRGGVQAAGGFSCGVQGQVVEGRVWGEGT